MKNLNLPSDELRLFRFANGVQLISPDKINKIKTGPFCYDTGHTVASILKLSNCISVTFLNQYACAVAINEFSAITSGFLSKKDALGKSILDTTKAKSGRIIMQHNRNVIDNQQKFLFEESILRKNNTSAEVITVKSPWYGENGEILGLFGCGLRLGVSPLAKSLNLIAEIGLLQPQKKSYPDHQLFPGKKIDDVYLTKRQCEILKYLVKGKSAKSIGVILDLSSRTVEGYLASIKAKLNVHSKAELIDKVFHYFYPE